MQARKKNKRLGFGKRVYRRMAKPRGLVSFNIAIKETDLWISAEKELIKEAQTLVLDARHQIESYIRMHPDFLTSLSPWRKDILAPVLVKEMISASEKAKVGPMAAVAGAIAEYVGKGLLRFTSEVIVENGGDVFIHLNRPVTVSIFSGSLHNMCIVIREDIMPVGVCSSSGKIGHSLSFGHSDIVTIISSSASIADAAATSIANKIKNAKDIENIECWASQIEGVLGALAFLNKNLSLWGNLELTLL